MDKKIVESILDSLKEKKIRFCILRNYENFEDNKDIDLLIDSKNGGEVKKILIKLGLVKRWRGWGPYLICDCKADIKIGCIDCDGRFFKSSKDVLSKRKNYKNFYILSPEDELEHLIVHSIVTKGKFKEYYKKKIESLIGKVNLKKVEKEFKSRFGNIGINVFDHIKNKEYEEGLNYRKEMMKKIRTLENLIKYYFNRINFFCKKEVMK